MTGLIFVLALLLQSIRDMGGTTCNLQCYGLVPTPK